MKTKTKTREDSSALSIQLRSGYPPPFTESKVKEGGAGREEKEDFPFGSSVWATDRFITAHAAADLYALVTRQLKLSLRLLYFSLLLFFIDSFLSASCLIASSNWILFNSDDTVHWRGMSAFIASIVFSFTQSSSSFFFCLSATRKSQTVFSLIQSLALDYHPSQRRLLIELYAFTACSSPLDVLHASDDVIFDHRTGAARVGIVKSICFRQMCQLIQWLFADISNCMKFPDDLPPRQPSWPAPGIHEPTGRTQLRNHLRPKCLLRDWWWKFYVLFFVFRQNYLTLRFAVKMRNYSTGNADVREFTSHNARLQRLWKGKTSFQVFLCVFFYWTYWTPHE